MATPNLGLALQARDAPDWDVPNNANFTTLDTVVGGGVSGNVLTSNGPNTAPTYQPASTPPGTGTVTSVGLTAPTEFAVTGSPITVAGTLAITKANQSANLVYAGPAAGAAAAPTFRALTAADLPFSPYTQTVLPGWWGSGEGSNYPAVTTAAGQWGTGTANQVKFWMIRLPYAIQVSKLTTRTNVALALSHSAFGMYDSLGATKLFSWDNFVTSTTGATLTTVLGAPVLLAPGIYLVACGCDTTGSPPATLGGYAATGTNEGVEPWNTNGTVRSGTAANPMVAGALPAALGVLSPGGGGFAALPLVIMEP